MSVMNGYLNTNLAPLGSSEPFGKYHGRGDIAESGSFSGEGDKINLAINKETLSSLSGIK
jgi:hypothetical protein